MKQKYFKYPILLYVFLALFFLNALSIKLFADEEAVKENKNVILVLDTSMSMIGYGGKDILKEVKTSIENYIDKLDKGDKVTFITFDTAVRIYPSILIEDANDRDIAKKYISMTEAKGKWTYTINMIKRVFQKADELEVEEEKEVAEKKKKLEDEDDRNKIIKRKTVIVMMTDALDDPPPGKRKERFDMKALSSEYEGKDWWIYLVSFNELKKNKQVEALRKELEKVSAKTRVIDAAEDPGKGIVEVEKDHYKPPVDDSSNWIVFALIGLAVLVLIIILLIVKAGGARVTGRIEYWNLDILNPYIEHFDMNRHQSNEIIIGRSVNSHLNIRDFELAGSFSITADKKLMGLVISPPEGIEVQFKNRKKGSVLEDGDVFEVSNYGFKYIAE